MQEIMKLFFNFFSNGVQDFIVMSVYVYARQKMVPKIFLRFFLRMSKFFRTFALSNNKH